MKVNIKHDITPSDYEVGVVVCRVQVHEFHEAHKAIFDMVATNHKKVIVFLGVAITDGTRPNPMDFATREAMVKASYPSFIVLPIIDQRDDVFWSKKLDEAITQPFGYKKVLLYGGRDSFKDHYKGKHPVVEIETDVFYSGTEVRLAVSKEILASSEFRAGVIHSVYAKIQSVLPTVDVVVIKGDSILLARKPNENKFRFIGGFVDVDDVSYEAAAKRELGEEAGLIQVSKMRYITSMNVDDWRVRGTGNSIMTSLFACDYVFGGPKANDDVEEVKWFSIDMLKNSDDLSKVIMEEHVELMNSFLKTL
jgi:bifunctional NMN adenylyltransferase/nudix hydrolase